MVRRLLAKRRQAGTDERALTQHRLFPFAALDLRPRRKSGVFPYKPHRRFFTVGGGGFGPNRSSAASTMAFTSA
jgi:hypothetical protein